MTKIRVKKELSPARSGSSNPGARTGSGNLEVRLNSLNAAGNVFVLDNAKQIYNTKLAYSTNSDYETQGYGTALRGISRVKLSNNLESIGPGAFYEAINLKEITIPDSVTYIDSSAFSYCSSLSAVNIFSLSSWTKINNQGNPLQYARHLYLNGDEVSVLNWDSEKYGTFVKHYAFAYCDSLISVSIPEDVSFGSDNRQFYDCRNLETISVLGNFNSSSNGGGSFNCNAECKNKLKNVYLGKQAINNTEFWNRAYDYVPGEGEDPSLSAVQIYYYSDMLGTPAISAQEDSQDAVYKDGTFLKNHPIPVLGTNVFAAFGRYDIHVPTAMYERWIAATTWNNLSSHIHPYAPVEYVAPTMELEMDDDKTYFIMDNSVAAAKMTVAPLDSEAEVTLSAYDRAEEE